MRRAAPAEARTRWSVLSDGPCWFCRRSMDWIAADKDCLPFCRWCLQYVLEAAQWAPEYARLLCRAGNDHARRRWDHQVNFEGVA